MPRKINYKKPIKQICRDEGFDCEVCPDKYICFEN